MSDMQSDLEEALREGKAVARTLARNLPASRQLRDATEAAAHLSRGLVRRAWSLRMVAAHRGPGAPEGE
jgi:hypothetical protein